MSSDIVSKAHRSRMMSGIKSKNTKPEIIVRQFLHKNGFRFRLHQKELPGTPDIVLAKYNTVIFVNGCYWHRHEGCKFAYIPKSNQEFWLKKFRDNVKRDRRNYKKLIESGWSVEVVWECEVKNSELSEKLINWLKQDQPHPRQVAEKQERTEVFSNED